MSLALGGCMRTYRAEQQTHTETTLNTDGTAACCHRSEEAEREWHGPWPLPPAYLRP